MATWNEDVAHARSKFAMTADSNTDRVWLLKRVRLVIGVFIIGLVASGITAFPLLYELELMVRWRGIEGDSNLGRLDSWLLTVRDGLRASYAIWPWLAYGTDWLAFAHLVIAVFFIGPLLDPVRNIWILYSGVIACVAVIPLALICGEIRGIPLGWRMIDCSFGVGGLVLLLYGIHLTRRLELAGKR